MSIIQFINFTVKIRYKINFIINLYRKIAGNFPLNVNYTDITLNTRTSFYHLMLSKVFKSYDLRRLFSNNQNYFLRIMYKYFKNKKNNNDKLKDPRTRGKFIIFFLII